MTAQEEGAARISLLPPPRWGPWAFIRRWRRSLGRHGGLRYWLLAQGFLIFFGLVCFFVINGFVIGWQVAYDVSVQIMSPWATSVPWLALLLALAGWLVVPALVGSVVGYVVAETANNRRNRPPNMTPTENGSEGSKYIPLLDRLLYARHGYDIQLDFVVGFVRLHDEKWNAAQDHWEMIVGDFLNTTAVDRDALPRQAVKQAVNAAAAFLTGPLDRCPKCSETVEKLKGNANP